jgi:acetyl esterase/lipase
VEIVDLGPVALRVHRPTSLVGPAPGLLWIHGGGFVIGSAAQDDAVCGHLAAGAGVVVAAVDYRRAPEHPFPTPLHDCYDALTWLAARADVDPNRLAVGGASAGGGLAAGLAILARQRGDLGLAFQLLAYPMLDDRSALRGDLDDRRTRLWDNRSNRYAWTAYLGTSAGGADVSPLAAPARCTDLVGLPPAWIGVGTHDILLPEGLAYAAALEAAGVPCSLEVVQGAFHGFDSIRPGAPVTAAFRASQVQALRTGLRSAPIEEERR